MQPFNSRSPAGNLSQDPLQSPVTTSTTQLIALTNLNDLPTQNHRDGMSIILNTQTSRFEPGDIDKIERVVDTSSGELTGIRLTCKENPAWLVRGLDLDGGDYTIGDYEENYIEFSAKSVEQLPFAETAKKFTTPTNALEVEHWMAVKKFDGILADLSLTRSYEQRLTFFDKDEGASGPLKSIMVKFAIFPDSNRALLKSMDDFQNNLIPLLQQKLGPLSHLIHTYGEALDGKPYIEFNPEGLKKLLSNEI